MNHELITSKLQAALDTVGETGRTDNFQLARIFHEPERAHPSVGQLLEALRGQPSLAIFDGKIQVLANQATRMEISDLAGWLIRRGRDVGSERAVADLQRYLEATEIPFSMALGFTGLKIDRQCDLGCGIVLGPWNNKRFPTSFGIKPPLAAVVQERIVAKLHVSGEEYQLSPLDQSELHDALLCISAVGPFAPEVRVSWHGHRSLVWSVNCSI